MSSVLHMLDPDYGYADSHGTHSWPVFKFVHTIVYAHAMEC
jgi:hypothetical protein